MADELPLPVPTLGQAQPVPGQPPAVQPPQGGGLAGLLRMLGPVLGGIAPHGGSNFLSGWQQAQEEHQKQIQEQQQQRVQQAQLGFAQHADTRAGNADARAQQELERQRQLDRTNYMQSFQKALMDPNLTDPAPLLALAQNGAPTYGVEPAALQKMTDAVLPKTEQDRRQAAKVVSDVENSAEAKKYISQGIDLGNVLYPSKDGAQQLTLNQWKQRAKLPVAQSPIPAVPTKPDTPNTSEEQNVADALAAAEAKKGSPLLPEERIAVRTASIKQTRGVSRNPELDAINLQLAQLRLDQQRKGLQGAVEIQPGTREYRVAQDLAYGRLTMSMMRSLLSRSGNDSGLKLSLYDKAAELNPNFNPAAFELGRSFAMSPKTQQQLASMDNVAIAIPDLITASDQASRSGVTSLNGMVNKAGYMIGGKRYSNFATAQRAFADELSGALGFGSASDLKTQLGIDMSDPNLSPANFASAIQDVIVPFVDRKRGSMLRQEGIYGTADFNPAAQARPAEQTVPPLTSDASVGGTYLYNGKKVKVREKTRTGFLFDEVP